MKLLFPLVATAFVGRAGASIYYSVRSGSNEENKGDEKGGLSGRKLDASKQVLETKKEEKEHETKNDEDVPDPDRKASLPDSQRIENIDGQEFRVFERILY